MTERSTRMKRMLREATGFGSISGLQRPESANTQDGSKSPTNKELSGSVSSIDLTPTSRLPGGPLEHEDPSSIRITHNIPEAQEHEGTNIKTYLNRDFPSVRRKKVRI